MVNRLAQNTEGMSIWARIYTQVHWFRIPGSFLLCRTAFHEYMRVICKSKYIQNQIKQKLNCVRSLAEGQMKEQLILTETLENDSDTRGPLRTHSLESSALTLCHLKGRSWPLWISLLLILCSASFSANSNFHFPLFLPSCHSIISLPKLFLTTAEYNYISKD